jgi:membrane protein required for colicin V production
MHWLDITLLIVLALGALLGARSGLLWQVARIVSFGAAFYISIYYHEPIAGLVGNYVTDGSPLLIAGLAYVGTFLGVYLVLHIITLVLERGVRATRLKTLDRILGAGFGVLKATLLIGAVMMGLAIYSTPQTDAAMSESKLAPVFLEGMRAVAVAVPQDYKDQFNIALERIRQESLNRANQLRDSATRKALEDQLPFPGSSSKPQPNASPVR